MSTEKTQNQIATFDQKLANVKNVKEIFSIPDVKERFIKNFEALTGRKDGANRLEQEKFAYLEILNEKPELKAAPPFSHFGAIVKAGTTGLSFRDNKLYVQPVKNREGVVIGLKVSSSPAGKREQFEMMPTVRQAPEAQVVVKGDIFLYDKLNHKIIEHKNTKESVTEDKLENITHSYQRIIWKDGTSTDVVVPHADLVQAKKKSKIKSTDAGLWVEWPAEACKKTATNRAFRLYHKYPDNVVVLDSGDDDVTDTAHEDVTSDFVASTSTENVDTDTGEVKTEPKQEPKAEEAKIVSTPDKKKQQMNLLDD